MERPFTVTVEGNIGSGKTTFLDYFNQFDNVCTLSEPIEKWRDCRGHNLLGYMYEDPQKWSFTFQSYVQLTMLKHHTAKTKHPIKLMERSIYSARYCFVENMAEEEILPKPAAAVIDEYFNWCGANSNTNVDLIIYLRTTPEVVYRRMMQRNRSEERCVPIEYLQKLHEIHENWLYNRTKYYCPAPVLTIDANLDKISMLSEYERCQPHILEKVAVEAMV